jgi:hypothetical protein
MRCSPMKPLRLVENCFRTCPGLRRARSCRRTSEPSRPTRTDSVRTPRDDDPAAPKAGTPTCSTGSNGRRDTAGQVLRQTARSASLGFADQFAMDGVANDLGAAGSGSVWIAVIAEVRTCSRSRTASPRSYSDARLIHSRVQHGVEPASAVGHEDHAAAVRSERCAALVVAVNRAKARV